MTARPPLPTPARYFPLTGGRYEVAAGLYRLGTDLGNGGADGHVFQLDHQWAAYHREKRAARRERLDKYVLTDRLEPALAVACADWMAARLAREHPGLFDLQEGAEGWSLHCHLSAETLHVDRQGCLSATGGEGAWPAYADALDALASQVQEDLAVMTRRDGGFVLAGLHLCFPNHWSPADKLGGDFAQVHAPVPGMGRINRQAPALQRSLMEGGPFVRFAWGLATDQRLNHHPQPAAHCDDPQEWHGRAFDPAAPQLHLRIERQTLCALPGTDAYVFTIRTYFTAVQELPAAQRAVLVAAIESMDAEALAYKGLARQREAILQWLKAGIRRP